MNDSSTHSERKHSWLSPSGMKPIYYGCVAKPYEEKGYPDSTNKAADEGTLAHEWVSHWLSPTDNPQPSQPCPPHLEDQAKAYVEFVHSLLEWSNHENPDVKPVTLRSKLIVEAKFDIFPSLEISGHVDAIVDNGEHIYVTDLKTGRTHVDAKHNVQMLCYALGYLKSLELVAHETRIFLAIFQYGKPSWYETTAGYILNEFAHEMSAKASVAKHLYEEKKIPTAGDYAAGDWCQWCKVRTKCSTYATHLQSQALVSFEPHVEGDGLPVVRELENEQLKRIVRITPLLEKYLADCHEELKVRASTEEGVEGVEVHISKGKRAWNKEREDEIAAYLADEGIEPYEQSLIGFTKLKKVVIPDEFVTYGKETIKIGIKDD